LFKRHSGQVSYLAGRALFILSPSSLPNPRVKEDLLDFAQFIVREAFKSLAEGINIGALPRFRELFAGRSNIRFRRGTLSFSHSTSCARLLLGSRAISADLINLVPCNP
jgi:hypothetical protein